MDGAIGTSLLEHGRIANGFEGKAFMVILLLDVEPKRHTGFKTESFAHLFRDDDTAKLVHRKVHWLIRSYLA